MLLKYIKEILNEWEEIRLIHPWMSALPKLFLTLSSIPREVLQVLFRAGSGRKSGPTSASAQKKD